MNSAPNNTQIRVLIVDDSAFMRAALMRIVASDPAIWVAGTASTGMEALLKLPSLDPDVITLDAEMPGLDGLQTLTRIMAEYPRPVIMVSSVTQKDAEVTFAALAAGAFDYVPKQLSSQSLDIFHLRDDLVAKIKAAGSARRSQLSRTMVRKPPQTVALPARAVLPFTPSIVAVGISTGGPKALQDILPALPADLGVPVVVVQHMPPGFTAPFAQRLNTLCTVSIREAENHDVMQPGVVYIAPAGIHLRVERKGLRGVICLSDKPEGQLHTPSVDIMMESVAAAFHSQVMGVIMTGMGSDGARGMEAIHREGGFTLGQDEPSCAVYGMPRVCAEMGILSRVAPLTQIPQEILHATRYRKAASAG
jgi:two-component system chemotaxis response regulator CheB